MPASQWHKIYTAHVAAPPGALFELLTDMPNYGRWLPGSQQFGMTTDVTPYPGSGGQPLPRRETR